MKGLLNQSGKLLLSYSYLEEQGIKRKTIEQAVSRRSVKPVKLNGKSFISYDSLLGTWKEKLRPKTELLALSIANHLDTQVEMHVENIYQLQVKGFIQYRHYYKEKYQLSNERLLEACQLRAVWEYILQVNNETGKLEPLYLAFDKLYSNKYSCKHSFSNAIKKVKENGIDCVCVDKRMFTAPKNVKRISEDCQYWTAALISLGTKLSNRKAWERIKELCKASNKDAPSKSWVDKYRKKILKNIEVYQSRYGATETKAKKLPYVSTISALHVNQQWQMDGKTIPIWMKYYDADVKAWKIFEKGVIVIIQDACSKKIIGWAYGRSENTTVILEALKKAIVNTGCLPIEIVTDNHAFHQTAEAENMKAEMLKHGCQWRITSNPQEKAIVERYNQYLDDQFSSYHGYLGKGIKSKGLDALPKQELIDKYAKNFSTEDEVKAICLKVVEDYNANVLRKYGKTPNELYRESDHSYGIQVDLFERIKLLTAKNERKVSRGQITIKRGAVTYEYQLPAHLYNQYNDESVIVRYEDLRDGIYIYDKKTDSIITDLQPKEKIMAAIANQDESDKEKLHKNKGRISGIRSKAKKELDLLRDKAILVNPNAVGYLNPLTTPKDIRKELEQNAQLKRAAKEEGINVEMMPVRELESLLTHEGLKPKEKFGTIKPLKSSKHTISLINVNDINE